MLFRQPFTSQHLSAHSCPSRPLPPCLVRMLTPTAITASEPCARPRAQSVPGVQILKSHRQFLGER
eukprot:6253170-Prymnesium_polylepis.1